MDNSSACKREKPPFCSGVAEHDINEEASRLVNEITESESVNGEDLLESPDLKRQLREAKERLKRESAEPPRK